MVDWHWHFRLLVFSLAALAMNGAAQAAAPRETNGQSVEVTLKCHALVGKSKVALNVLEEVSTGGMHRLPIKAAFDAQGQCKVELPAGQYCFEVLFLDNPATLIALKMPQCEVKESTVLDLPTLDPQPVEISLPDQSKAPQTELAIRSAAPIGEVSWKADRKNPGPPKVIASPNQRYHLRAMAENDTTKVAYWQTTPANAWNLKITSAGVNTCRFHLLTDGPAARRTIGTMAFPDSKMEFPLTAETVFLTNRRFLSFGYRLELENGRLVAFHPHLGEIRKTQTFTIGGPLKPCAWGTIMKRKLIDKPVTQHLVCGADLCDPQGCLVDHRESKIDWDASVQTPWGPVGRDVELSADQVQALKDPARSMTLSVSYCLDKPDSVKLEPVGFNDYSIRRFKTRAPSQWSVQAVNYLAKARRVFRCVEEYEGKPSKHGLEIQWHNTGGTAWGGGHTITMPFRELVDNFDHYATPWALTHEILHTFGYPHGPRMSQASEAVSRMLARFRWYMADHPSQDPNSGFDLFLASQREQ